MKQLLTISLFFIFACASLVNAEQKQTTQMNNAVLQKLIERLDIPVKGEPGYWQLKYQGLQVYIITDEKADRMRIISPIKKSDVLSKDNIYRLLQANFDSALDARYSIAKQTLWSAYIHPLSELTEKQFFSGFAQTINLVNSYGRSYSSGGLIFRGGDSDQLNKKTYDDIMKRGLGI